MKRGLIYGLPDLPRPCDNPSWTQANTPAPFTPRHSVALDLGWTQPGRRLDCGTQRQPRPRAEPGWGGSNRCWPLLKQPKPLMAAPPQLTPQYPPRVGMRPTCPTVRLQDRAEEVGAGGSDQLGGTKGTWPPGLHLKEARKTNVGACAGSTSETAQIFVYSGREPRARMGLTCFSIPLLWGKGPGAGRGENTHLKGTEPAQVQPSRLLL